jgi:arylsulfatase A-like enzyme
MIRSADYHIGRLVDYVLKIDPNTVVALTGDHGAREHPIYTKNENVTNETTYNSDCVNKNTGNDNMFSTSGFISYPSIGVMN